MRRGPFSFLFFFTFQKMTQSCLGSTKMEIFYWEKAFHAGKKIRKNDFARSEKFSCYAPGPLLIHVTVALPGEGQIGKYSK